MRLSDRVLTIGTENTQQLLTAILHKQQLLAANDAAHVSIKTALIIGAGAMRGVYSGGVVTALEQLGLTDTFDVVIGISAGAATAGYFVAGQAAVGTTIYYEELASRKFINPWRFNNILQISYLEQIFTTLKPLDQTAIRASRSRLYIGVTNVLTAEPEYVPVNNGPTVDIIKFIQASSSVPGLTPPIKIDGTVYGDGITSCKNPIGYAIDVLGCTDVLYVANQPLRPKPAIGHREKISARFATRNYSSAFQQAYVSRHSLSDESAATTYPATAHIGILCPERTTIRRLTKNAQALSKVAQEAQHHTLALFDSVSGTTR